jgi:hypothetical protein
VAVERRRGHGDDGEIEICCRRRTRYRPKGMRGKKEEDSFNHFTHYLIVIYNQVLKYV